VATTLSFSYISLIIKISCLLPVVFNEVDTGVLVEYIICLSIQRSRDSTVGIATGYGLDE
jgi:hypothetical protein